MPHFTQAEYLANEARRARENGVVKGETHAAAEHEGDLHNQILAECKRRGWIALHSRMDTETGRPKGEWDFSIRADGGRVIECECKKGREKLTTEQLGMIQWETVHGSVFVFHSRVHTFRQCGQ